MTRYDWYCEDVLSGKIEINKVWEDERVLAFQRPPIDTEINVWVISKLHVSSLMDPLALDGFYYPRWCGRFRRQPDCWDWIRPVFCSDKCRD